MTRAIALALFAFTSSPVFAGSVDEEFESAGSNCDAVWFNGCVDGWTGIGATASVARTHIEGDNTREGVLIRGGTSQAPNGIQRTFALPSGTTDHAKQVLQLQSVDSSGDFDAKLTFRDAQGAVVSTSSALYTVSANKGTTLEAHLYVPSNAVSVDVSIELRGATATVFVESWMLDTGLGGQAGGVPESSGYCNDEADELNDALKTLCEATAGTYLGACAGTPAPTESGCKFACLGGCEEDEEAVVEPVGF